MESENCQLHPVDAGTLEREQARLLYEYAGPGVIATTIASTFLAVAFRGQPTLGRHPYMGAAMQVVVAFRGWDMWRWREQTRQTSYDGKRQIARFSKGALTQAVGWGMFPLFFFHEIGQMDRAAMAIILSAMACGAVTVLSPSLRLAVQFCMFLLLSPSFMFLRHPDSTGAHVSPRDLVGHPDE